MSSAIVVALLVAAGSTAVAGEAPPAPPDARSADAGSCLAGGCHGGLLDRETVHAAAEDCSLCHEPEDVGHRYRLAASEVRDLCLGCHDDPVGEGRHAHAPVEAGECVACHDPHASEHRFLLVEGVPALCVACHTDQADELALAVVHGVVRDPGCTTCHDAHASALATLLVADGVALCAACHLPRDRDAGAGSGDTAVLPGGREVAVDWLDAVPKIVINAAGIGHPTRGHPVAGAADPTAPGKALRCGSCHAPHASTKSALRIVGPDGGFCSRCHRK